MLRLTAKIVKTEALNVYIVQEKRLNKFQKDTISSRIKALGLTGIINPFLANVPILYPLRTPENQRFSNFFFCVFKGCKMETLAKIRLSLLKKKTHFTWT